MPKTLFRQARTTVVSQTFNLDNGNGTTVDEVLIHGGPIGARILRVYALYQEVAQTVAGGNFKLGTAAGGATIVAATAYTDTAAIGSVTEGVVLVDRLLPNASLWVRHTGVASTQTGTAKIVVEFVYDE